MQLAVSTHWNAHRHGTGESMLTEILDAGFRHVELGYDLTIDLVEGVQRMVADKAVEVTSLHNYCPVPIGAPMGHPEIFDLSSPDGAMRASAVTNTRRTMEFASELGAQAVVTHCGYVDMRNMTTKLLDLSRKDKMFSKKYEKIKTKLILKRGSSAGPRLDALRRSLEELLPDAETYAVKLCPENMPLWEAVPSEIEMTQLIDEFKSPWLGYWHDIGHGQIRQDLGFSSQSVWVERLKPTGFHVHDVDENFQDHLMPPRGKVDFETFKAAANGGSLLVLEPAPATPTEYLIEAAEFLRNCWKQEG